MFYKISVVLLFGLTAVFQGCQSTPTQSGAMGGAAIGAIAGQLIGGDTESTLLGAGAGALGGAIMNDYRHQQKQKAYNEGYNDARAKGNAPTPPPYSTSSR